MNKKRYFTVAFLIFIIFALGLVWQYQSRNKDEGTGGRTEKFLSAGLYGGLEEALSAIYFRGKAEILVKNPPLENTRPSQDEQTSQLPLPQQEMKEPSNEEEVNKTDTHPETASVEDILAQMTLREKVYQMFVVFPSAVTGVPVVTAAGETTRKALEQYPVGGFIYDKTNMVSKEQVRTMLTKVQTYSQIPLILTCDEEGGRVNRLMQTVGTTWVDSMLDYKDQGESVAQANAKTIATDLVSCGFNMDLAPVADVWSNPDNKVIGDRAYSDDFNQAAELVAAAVKGFKEGGVACTLKHFPGHGDTSADSHYGSVYVYKSLDELRSQELLPFQAGIDAGADAVMIGHLIIADVDSEPALFSYQLVTKLLRQEMGFEGVVITDSLQMQAMTDYYGSGDIAVKAVKAGVDILLCPKNLDEAANALIQAVESGEISQERIDESVRRILTLKKECGIL